MQREGIYIKDINTTMIGYITPNINFKKLLKLINSISMKKAKKEIIEYCNSEFKIVITNSEFKPLLRRKTFYPKNAMVILMAIYNIIKINVECDNSSINSLLGYINLRNQQGSTYIKFTLGNIPSSILAYSADFNRKYDILIQFLQDTYNIVMTKTHRLPMYNICLNHFPFEKFTIEDIKRLNAA